MESLPKVGDEVEWVSQAGGCETTKRGTVVYSGEPIGYVHTSLREHQRMPQEVQESKYLQFGTVRYGVIVRVESKTKRGAPKYYAPRLKNLKLTTP